MTVMTEVNAMEREHNAWRVMAKVLAAHGIDLDDKKTADVILAITGWGHRYCQLREQGPRKYRYAKPVFYDCTQYARIRAEHPLD